MACAGPSCKKGDRHTCAYCAGRFCNFHRGSLDHDPGQVAVVWLGQERGTTAENGHKCAGYDEDACTADLMRPLQMCGKHDSPWYMGGVKPQCRVKTMRTDRDNIAGGGS